jgi:MerR family mercuric resistance operon transcriptional regulator
VGERLTIGEFAKQGGVNVETIRYYQRRGLLREPEKPHEGYRRYPQESVRQVRFIKRAQGLGFTLEEIHSLLALGHRNACPETRAIAARKLELIERKIADLSRMQKALVGLVCACAASSSDDSCPIIHSLLADD